MRRLSEIGLTGLLFLTVSCGKPGEQLSLFVAERQAYHEWRAWQDTVSLQLIGDIWDLWYGGTALWSWQEAYLKDLMDQEREELRRLSLIVSGGKIEIHEFAAVSMDEIEAETRAILTDVDNRFDAWREAGTGEIVVPDYFSCGLAVKPRMAGVMERDLQLLGKWMEARNEFSKSLPSRQRLCYGSLTNERLWNCRWRYRTRFLERPVR